MFRNNRLKRAVGAITLLTLPVLYSSTVYADAAAPISAEDLLQLMQFEGLISKEQAEKVKNIAKDRVSRENQAPVEYTSQEDKDKPAATEPGVTRVPYIPQYLKDEIRDEVRMELKEEVVNDVMAQAKTESWGVPGTNPDWTKRIKFKGDIRFRYQGERFDNGNSTQYQNFNAINDAGGTTAAGTDAFINTTEDRDRLRLRARLGMEAKVTQGVTASIRLATGDPDDPVSTTQTLGNYGGDYQISLDQAFIRFNPMGNEYQLTLGRMPNPWLSTELVWDDDLNFDGAAFSYYFNRGDDMYDDEQQFDPFITVGAFPLQEVQLSGNDKWLYGAQFGFSYLTSKQNELKMGLAYYYFDNISGIKNTPDSTLTNYSAPPFVQKGNTMFDISNSTTNPQAELWALAADYQELDLSVVYDMANFAPIHVIFTGDYVENIGYDRSKMQSRAGASVEGRTTGYDLGINVGWPTVLQRGNWNAGLNYRYLERDAVVDAFTDSDFHLGGTDGQGYKLSFRYGIEENTWTQLRLISTNEIDGPPLGVLTVLADLNVKF
ncbi:MAG: putative porin [Gammaproteobacteria bacterium]|nr:putative porin [Gammaproteobacteria bacterium]